MDISKGCMSLLHEARFPLDEFLRGFFFCPMSFRLELMMDLFHLNEKKSIHTTKFAWWKTGFTWTDTSFIFEGKALLLSAAVPEPSMVHPPFTFLIGGVPFLIFNNNFMIFLSFCSSALSVLSSTSTWKGSNQYLAHKLSSYNSDSCPATTLTNS